MNLEIDTTETAEIKTSNEISDCRMLELNSLIMRLSCAMEKFSFMKEDSTTFDSQCKRNMSSISSKSWKKLNFFRIMWRRDKKKQTKQNKIKSPKFTITKTEDLEQLLTICYDIIEYLDDRCDDEFQRNQLNSKRNVDEDTFTIWDHMDGAKEKLNKFKNVDMYGEKSDSEKTELASENGILQSVQLASDKQTEWTQVVWKTYDENSTEEPKSVSNEKPEYPINGADYMLLCLNSSTNNEIAELFEIDRFNEELVVEISPNNATNKNLLSIQQEHVQIEINDQQFVNYDENFQPMGYHLVSEDKKDFEINEDDKEQMCHSFLSTQLVSEPFEEIENNCCCDCSCHKTENDFSEDSLDLESLHLGTYQALESSAFMSRLWHDEDPSIFFDSPSLKLMAPNIVPSNVSKSSSTITDTLTSSSIPCSKTLPLPVGECSNGWKFPEAKCESKNTVENDDADTDEKYSANVNAHEVFGGFFRHFAEYIFDRSYNPLRKRFL